MSGRILLATAVAALAALAAPPPAVSAPPAPADLRVEGGEAAWHPRRAFALAWTIPPATSPVAAVHYRVRDPAGALVVGPARIGWPAQGIEELEVPGPPGVYEAAVWFEDTAGGIGPATTAKLRFDDERPGGIEPLLDAAWIGRDAFPLPIRLTHPAGEPPISGIRGYAVSVGGDPEHRPCAAADRCTEAETDLRGGAGDDTLAIADLPEGTSHLAAVAVSGSGMASAAPGRLVLRVDKTSPATRLAGVPAGWTAEPTSLTAVSSDGGSGMRPAPGGLPPYTAIAVDGGAPIAATGPSVSTTLIAEGVHHVACSSGSAAPCALTKRGRGGVRSIRTVATAAAVLPPVPTLPDQTVRFGESARLHGRLLTAAGRPLGPLPVRVVERFAGGADPPVRVSTVTSGADGGFALRLAPGPSREVTAAFDGTAALARSASAAAALGVRSSVRLRASSKLARIGGAPLVFRGRVAAAPGTIPVEGKSVQLQFRLAGLPWSEFRTIQTDRRGRFRYAYRFSDDDSRGVRFRFRAYAPAQGGWPYEPAGSNPVAVRGL